MPSPASVRGEGNGTAASTGFSGGGDGYLGRGDNVSSDEDVSPKRTAWGAAKRRKQEGNGIVVAAVDGDKAGAPAPEVGSERLTAFLKVGCNL